MSLFSIKWAKIKKPLISIANNSEEGVVIFTHIAKALEAISINLAKIRFILNRPGSLKIVLLSEQKVGNMDIISFKVVLPKLTDNDVVNRELSVKVGDAEPLVQTVDITVAEVEGFSGEQDLPVVLSLVDIDDAGNRSTASELNTVLTDILPPATPGELSIVETSETVTKDESTP